MTTSGLPRRSPRLLRVDSNRCDPTACIESRRLRFHESRESASVPSCADSREKNVTDAPEITQSHQNHTSGSEVLLHSSAETAQVPNAVAVGLSGSANGTECEVFRAVMTGVSDPRAHGSCDQDSESPYVSKSPTVPPKHWPETSLRLDYSDAVCGRSYQTTPPRDIDEISGDLRGRTQVPNRNANGHTSDEEGGAVEIRISEADETSAVYGFLWTLSVKDLRPVLKHWGCKQGKNKLAYISRAFLYLKTAVLSGKTLQATLHTHPQTARFSAWLQRKLERDELSPMMIRRAPQESTLLQEVSVGEAAAYKRLKLSLERARYPRNSIERPGRTPLNQDHQGQRAQNTESATYPSYSPSSQPEQITYEIPSAGATPSFSISEFSRLCVVMRDDELAKAALAGTGQELSRAQLDTGFTRDSYWGIIESRFNSQIRLRLDLVGRVDDADSTFLPPCHRCVSFLKDTFMERRAQFTEILQKWKASGQNDPDNFRNFLTYGANGQFNAVGKRLMVLFTCTRQGTDHADENFTNMCTKVIPQGGGYDEGGSGQGNGDGFAKGKKRKRRDTESGESMKTSFKQLVNVVTDSHRMRAESQCIMEERRVEKREESGSSKELRDF